jgi:hypothetical protein
MQQLKNIQSKLPKPSNFGKFPEKELRGYSPSSYIHVSVCDLYEYIPLIGLPILLQENRWTERGNI